MKKYSIITIILFLLLIPVLSYADSIFLKDDSVYHGNIYDVTDDKIFISTSQGDKNFSINKIVKIIVDKKVPNYNIPNVNNKELRERVLSKLEELYDNPDYKIEFIGLLEAIDNLYETNNNYNEDNDNNSWDNINNNNNNFNNDTDYNWENNNDNDNNDDYNPPYYPQKDKLINSFSIGVISTFDFFYRFSPPFFGLGLGVKLNSTNKPFEFIFNYEASGNILMDYEDVGTVFVNFWNIFTLGSNYRFLPDKFITPFIGASLGFHHLIVNVSGVDRNYGAIALMINGGVEFIIDKSLSIILNIKKHISLVGNPDNYGYFYDPEFYDELFGIFKFSVSFYANIGI